MRWRLERIKRERERVELEKYRAREAALILIYLLIPPLATCGHTHSHLISLPRLHWLGHIRSSPPYNYVSLIYALIFVGPNIKWLMLSHFPWLPLPVDLAYLLSDWAAMGLWYSILPSFYLFIYHFLNFYFVGLGFWDHTIFILAYPIVPLVPHTPHCHLILFIFISLFFLYFIFYYFVNKNHFYKLKSTIIFK